MIQASGNNGQMTFDGTFVTLTRKGVVAKLSVGGGEKRIPLAQISAVQWKGARMGGLGYLQLTLPGGNESRSSFLGATQGAFGDENSVTFTRRQQPEWEALRAALDEAITARYTQQPAVAQQPTDVADQLSKLAALREQGVLSDDEFQAQKAKLLA